ncbi:MAG: hypothetical protein B7Z15_21480 [Rhizobiales bacterium 32-66-8]|nr:MAG: hypothetical protein B7Z15_21480 [Rhizobiales bacterium 32-66-8]
MRVPAFAPHHLGVEHRAHQVLFARQRRDQDATAQPFLRPVVVVGLQAQLAKRLLQAPQAERHVELGDFIGRPQVAQVARSRLRNPHARSAQ